MDPLGAFAVACNALQVVEYGTKVIITAAELFRSMRGGASELKQLDAISSRLKKLSEQLLNLNARSTTATQIPSSVVLQLNGANEEVLELSIALHQLIGKYQPTGQDLRASLDCLGKAFRLNWKRADIDRLAARLAHARSNLMLAFLLYMQ